MSDQHPLFYVFREEKVRVFLDAENQPWFVGKDVALALGYCWNGAACFDHVPEEWKEVRTVLTTRGEKEMVTLSEPGLYFFLGRSDKPAALPFQKWLAGEVLPSIRRCGRYVHHAEEPPAEGPFSIRPEDLPDDVRRIGPRQRERYMGLALQAARIAGESDMQGVFGFFVDMCRTLTAGSLALAPSSPEYARESVRRFVHDCCQSASPRQQMTLNMLYAAYENWCDMQDEDCRPISKDALRRILPDIAPTAKIRRPRVSGGRAWYVCGLRLDKSSPCN